MLVLNDDHVERLQDLFERFIVFERDYNKQSNHYPSTFWYDIKNFCKDVNEFNSNIDVSKLESLY